MPTKPAPEPTFAPRKLRRLFLDIETSPNTGYFWRSGWDQTIDADNIIEERKIICVGFKWHGEKEVHALNWTEEQDDGPMLKKILEVMQSADEIVAHNGDKFDMPWIKTRCLFHNLPTWPAHKTIDTLQWARRKLYFNSNKLNYIAQYLGFGAKIKTEFSLWKKVVGQNDRKALADMVTYCKRDVELLEKVYDRLAGHVNTKSHVGVLAGKPKWSCPACGGIRLQRVQTRTTAAGTVQHQMTCGKPHLRNRNQTSYGCGRVFQISDPVYRAWTQR